jgi:hypothetical protein
MGQWRDASMAEAAARNFAFRLSRYAQRLLYAVTSRAARSRASLGSSMSIAACISLSPTFKPDMRIRSARPTQ